MQPREMLVITKVVLMVTKDTLNKLAIHTITAAWACKRGLVAFSMSGKWMYYRYCAIFLLHALVIGLPKLSKIQVTYDFVVDCMLGMGSYLGRICSRHNRFLFISSLGNSCIVEHDFG
jgi:hypothetical protein